LEEAEARSAPKKGDVSSNVTAAALSRKVRGPTLDEFLLVLAIYASAFADEMCCEPGFIQIAPNGRRSREIEWV
jgi:hypothetical protein